MIVTKASNPSVYNQMLAARRASLIQAALVVHKAEGWVAAQENQMALELEEISAAKDQSHENADLNVVISKHEEQVMARHTNLAARLKVFKPALAEFKERIKKANSGENLAGFDMTRDNYYQGLPSQFSFADCPVPGKDLYAALDKERALSRFDEDFVFDVTMTPVVVAFVVGYVCGLVVCPWLLLLIPAAIIVALVVAVLLNNTNDQIQLDQPVFSKKELTALLEEGKEPAVKVSVSPSSMFNSGPFAVEETSENESLFDRQL